jgi:hypothetical protein
MRGPGRRRQGVDLGGELAVVKPDWELQQWSAEAHSTFFLKRAAKDHSFLEVAVAVCRFIRNSLACSVICQGTNGGIAAVSQYD